MRVFFFAGFARRRGRSVRSFYDRLVLASRVPVPSFAASPATEFVEGPAFPSLSVCAALVDLALLGGAIRERTC